MLTVFVSKDDYSQQQQTHFVLQHKHTIPNTPPTTSGWPKSPLRYAGGKTRGATEICSFIPDNTQYLYSPFLGGGSVEILCASHHNIKVRGFDNYLPLVEFWQCLLENPKHLANMVREYFPLKNNKQFYDLQRTHGQKQSKYRRAAIYYVINRCSFSGATMSGGLSPGHPRFTESAINRLEAFKAPNLTVELADFTTSINDCNKFTILYLDPPYMTTQGLYGTRGDMHRGFNHQLLASILQKRNNWILSYNNTKTIRDLYAGNHFHYPRWKYGMSNNKDSREILIISRDLARKHELLV